MKKFIQSQIYYLEIALTDKNGDFITTLPTGDIVTYEVRKSSDGSLAILPTGFSNSGTMTVDGDVFKVAVQFDTLGQYRVLYFTPNKYENGSETIEVVEEITDDLSGIISKLNRLLGLNQENYRIFTPVYNANNDMTSAIIKIYPTATDCNNDTNVLATYNITATYSSPNKMSGYKVTKA